MGRHRNCVPILPEEQVFFEAFYNQYRNFLFYIARSYTADPAACEDVVQDAVVRLMRNVPKLQTLAHPQLCKYIKETVQSSYLDSTRRKRELLSLDDVLMQNILGAEREMGLDLSTRWEVQLLRQELTAREWLVLEGKYILEYSPEELGDLVGVSPESIRSILSRARKRSREILGAGNVSGGGGNE